MNATTNNTNTITREAAEAMTVKDLKATAKAAGYKGYSRMTKSALVALLTATAEAETAEAIEATETATATETAEATATETATAEAVTEATATETAEAPAKATETTEAVVSAAAKVYSNLRASCGVVGRAHRGASEARYYTVEDVAVGAFLVACADCGLEDLTDSAEAVEAGTSYQSMEYGLFRGRGRNAVELARVHIPTTRGKINVPAWLTSRNVRVERDGSGNITNTYVVPVTYRDVPEAYVQAPTTDRALLLLDSDGNITHKIRTAKDGSPVPQRLGLKAFLRSWVAPICAAMIAAATGLRLDGLTYSIAPIVHGEVIW